MRRLGMEGSREKGRNRTLTWEVFVTKLPKVNLQPIEIDINAQLCIGVHADNRPQHTEKGSANRNVRGRFSYREFAHFLRSSCRSASISLVAAANHPVKPSRSNAFSSRSCAASHVQSTPSCRAVIGGSGEIAGSTESVGGRSISGKFFARVFRVLFANSSTY